MAQIGTFVVTAFVGLMEPASQKNAVLEADTGTDGNGVVIGAWSATPVDITTHVDTTDDPESIRESYRNISGTVITVIDQFSKTWTNVTVLGVRVVYARIVGANTYRVSAAWRLLPDTVTP